MAKGNAAHYLIELKGHGDERGGLAVIEGSVDIPFQIERVFYEYNTTGIMTRGNHANKNSRFCFVSLAGSCCVEVDDGHEKVEYVLDSPLKLLYLDKMTWKVMKNYSANNVLLVLSDHKYDANEYIRDYNEFKTLVRGLTS